MKNSIIIIVFLIFMLASAISEKKIVCYYGSWATYRRGNGQMSVNNINPNLCTHIIYSFVGADTQGYVKVLDTNNDIINGGFENFIKLKQRNPKVKLLIAMGGWNEGSEKYSNIMKSDIMRQTLVNSIIKFTQTWGFDGFDMDWEYPSQRGGSPGDYQNYIKFLKELRDASPKGFIMSAAVGAADYLTSSSYDVKNMNKYLDFFNLMTYDYHGSWDTVTGHNAPLYSLRNTVSNWIKSGASPSKLIVGIPVYGRTWTLSDPNSHGVGAPTSGIGIAGQYTLENGMMTYLEICENFFAYPEWTKSWDNVQKVPYAFRNKQWLSFDDVKSVEIKAQFTIEQNLGGVMIWSIDGDDAFGVCGERPYPILNAINRALKV